MEFITSFFLSLLLFESSAFGSSVNGTIHDHWSVNEWEENTALDSSTHLFWNVNFYERYIEIGVSWDTSSLGNPVGWLGFGISPLGSMKGADITIVRFLPQGPEIGDYFSEDFVAPQLDPPYLQNSVLLDAGQTSDTAWFSFRRPLVTCDEDFDFNIELAATLAMFAYGNLDKQDQIQYHERRGSKKVSFLRPESIKEAPTIVDTQVYTISKGHVVPGPAELAKTSGKHVLEVAHEPYIVPSKQTTYTKFKIDLAEYVKNFQATGTTIQIKAFDGLITSDLVHHMHLNSCTPREYSEIDDEPFEQYATVCSPILSWALGLGYTEFNDDLHLPLETDCSDPDVRCMTKLVMEIHFENRFRRAGVVDSSGMRLYFDARHDRSFEDELGLFTLAAPLEQIQIPPGKPNHQHEMECPSEFTNTFTKPVRMALVVFHGHNLLRRASLRLIRNGKEMDEINSLKHYDFDKQTPLEIYRKLLPGDRLILKCEFNSTGETKLTSGGYTSEDEMCMAFLAIYPKSAMPYEVCSLHDGNVYAGNLIHSDGSEVEDLIPVKYDESGEMGFVTSRNFEPTEISDKICHRVIHDAIVDPISLENIPGTYILFSIATWIIYKCLYWIIRRNYANHVRKPEDLDFSAVYATSFIVLTFSLGCGINFLASGFESLIETDTSPESNGNFKNSLTLSLLMVPISANFIAITMMFELAARPRTGFELIIHHVFACLLVVILGWALVRTLNPDYGLLGILFTLYATTEQPLYIVLGLRRLNSAYFGAKVYITCIFWYAITKILIFAFVTRHLARMSTGIKDYSAWLEPVSPAFQSGLKIFSYVLNVGLFLIQIRVTYVLVQMYFKDSAKEGWSFIYGTSISPDQKKDKQRKKQLMSSGISHHV